MAEFLFEIGFEEMPASWLSDLAKQLQTKFESLASEAQLSPTGTRVLWTSRRLVLVADVKARQDDRTVVEWGPAAKIAKDAAGNWSKAAEGFAKKQGVSLDALTLAAKVEGSADLYVSAKKDIAGRATGDVLADSIASLLRGFNFPKRMNWDAWIDDGRGAFEFGRPIQWIVALLDGTVVPFSIFNATAGAKGAARLVSGRRSMGNRFYPRDAKDRGFDVKSFADLDAGLASRFVILDPAKRAERIKGQVEAAGGKVEGEAAHLVEEWNDLVEYPTLAIGSIPKEFADLPIEVLETVLAHHQKAITLPAGKDGAPRFAAISGCDDAGATNAARGQERVVVARLKDARFFWDEDRKRTLESRVDDLANVTFQKGLGSYKDKGERMSALAAHIAKAAGASDGVAAAAGRAAKLAKADLVTLMVREFPELQGVMGGLYAGGESQAVGAAVRWHYHPVAVEHNAAPAGRLQADDVQVFALVSLADKLDTLAGYFGLGLIPSGSSDPYALRRAGQGAVRVLLDFFDWGRADLSAFVDAAFATYGSSLKSSDGAGSQLRAFLVDRVKAALYLRGDGLPEDIEAAFGAKRDRLADITLLVTHIDALGDVMMVNHAEFLALAESFKRAKNIVGEGTSAAVDEGLFTEDAERKLYASIQKAEKTPSSDPAARLRAVAALRDDVDGFFKGVMVNAEEPQIRANRHAILRRLLDLVYEIADLSKLAAPASDSAAHS